MGTVRPPFGHLTIGGKEADTRLVELETPLVWNPLEEKLGFHQFGRYEGAVNGQNFAYGKIEDCWTIDNDSESESENEDETEPDQIMAHDENLSTVRTSMNNNTVVCIEKWWIWL